MDDFAALLAATTAQAATVITPEAGAAVHLGHSPWYLDKEFPRVVKMAPSNAHPINFQELTNDQITQLLGVSLTPLESVGYPGQEYSNVVNCKTKALDLICKLKILQNTDNRLFDEINKMDIFKSSQPAEDDRSFKANGLFCCIWDLMVGGFKYFPPNETCYNIRLKRAQLNWVPGYDHNASVLTPFMEAVARWIDYDGCFGRALHDENNPSELWLNQNLHNFIKENKQDAAKWGIWSMGGLKLAQRENRLHRDMIKGIYYDHAMFLEGFCPGFLYACSQSGNHYVTVPEKMEIGGIISHSALARHIQFGEDVAAGRVGGADP
jgi:hypothetical protein